MGWLNLETLLYSGALGLIIIGIVGMVLARHLFRTVLALVIAEAGANLLLVLSGYRWHSIAPVLTDSHATASMVDPIPQAMVLTAIVIGVGVQALAISLLLKLSQCYGTLLRSEIVQRMDEDIAVKAGLARSGSLDAPVGDRALPAFRHTSARQGKP